ncbi:UvrB/UvrC motif-containing protein [Vallitalea pronyensis]|uniref:UvrB/UvrC motif-containing protein n=1 Tax=Vallitalea pronyensis TaxID=1348613 RepID=A0A8J8MMT7_9FIRM|nr:UvrB/UvrC motif-containing protein [Vallitalea pronyensis]QUI24364.1 UvrB/UvrC motif-containing protein [Vallitalea pronyensis]
MLCERCQQEPATVFLNQTIDGKKKEIHLCNKCAMEVKDLYQEKDISIENFLSSLLDMNHKKVAPHMEQQKKSHVLQCKQCGMTYNEFRQKGKFGCHRCYSTFGNLLSPVIKRVHGSNLHTGKIPNRTGEKLLTQKQIRDLESKLKQAVKKEEYEAAAGYRDAIRALKKEGGLC